MIATKQASVIGAALLVAGTSIGGGMLALPVLTSTVGIVPSAVTFIVCYLFMTCTALLMAEVSLASDGETNLVSMAGSTLGFFGKVSTWILYLFLFYCLTLAYVTECGSLGRAVFSDAIPSWLMTLAFIGVFAPFVYVGTRAVEGINGLLMLGLILTFTGFVVLGVSEIEVQNFPGANWPGVARALPISFISFAFQGVVPTLAWDMRDNPSALRRSILLGGGLVVICYIVWQVLVQGIVPTYGPGGLVEALEAGSNAILPLKATLNSPVVIVLGSWFGLFALLTSMLGVALALRDFLADGLGIEKDAKGRVLLCTLVFAPAYILSLFNPGIFLSALEVAGGIGSALLLGFMPILMAWRLRYQTGQIERHLLPGGRTLKMLLMLFIVVELGCQILRLAGQL